MCGVVTGLSKWRVTETGTARSSSCTAHVPAARSSGWMATERWIPCSSTRRWPDLVLRPLQVLPALPRVAE